MENGALCVTWSSTDAASGVDGSTCELRVREDEGTWQPFSTDCAGDEVHSAAQPGHVYTFRLSASDNVSNPASTEALARFPRVTKYYYHGGQRVAMRADGVVYYLHGDHLGSVSLATNADGGFHSRQLFLPYGDTRWQEGALPTDFGFGGQRHDGSTGLVFMHARYYHAGLGRFTQADTIVPQPGNPQDFNRYAYVRNNPVLYTDPSGHAVDMYRNSIYGVVDYPLAEPPSPEKVREVAIFLAVSVPVVVYGGPLLGDLAGAAYDAATLGYLRLANAHPLLTKLLLGVGGSTVTAELSDADDDEVQLLEAGQEAIRSHSEMKGPVGDGLDSHHIVQDAWAQRQNIPGYSREAASAVRLPPAPNHRAANAVQRMFRQQHGWDTTFEQEIQLARDALQAAGLSSTNVNQAIESARQYFTRLQID